ncbi:MAG: ABC transporter ATP-binding protein [Eggerthellales bacterium]|nr:ABC transporter ATP-binding protein [Eggerthellales bacterium]
MKATKLLSDRKVHQDALAAAAAESAEHLLQVKGLKCGYGKKNPVEIVHGVDFCVDKGEFLCVIGSNGCGKTTTLKAVMGLLPAMAGQVLISGQDVHVMNEKEKARHFAYIPQAHTPPFPFSVADVVMMGRTPYVNKLSRVTKRDRMVAGKALDLLGIRHLAKAEYTNLSGGQRQLVLIARALAQESDMLIMDEPTAALDFGNQHLVLSCMKTLSKLGKAVVMVTHDPDHALFCADRVLVMGKGKVIKEGTAAECITTDVLQQIYGATARVVDVEVEPGRIERVVVPLQ